MDAPSKFCNLGIAFAIANSSSPSAVAWSMVFCDLHCTSRHMKCAAKRRLDLIVFLKLWQGARNWKKMDQIVPIDDIIIDIWRSWRSTTLNFKKLKFYCLLSVEARTCASVHVLSYYVMQLCNYALFLKLYRSYLHTAYSFGHRIILISNKLNFSKDAL